MYEVRCYYYFYGMTRTASVYEARIPWRLYEAARTQRLRDPLEIGRDLFHLEFPLFKLCAP